MSSRSNTLKAASLRVEGLSLEMPDGRCLVEGLSFEVGVGEVMVLMGPSGSGKSTLLSWLSGGQPAGFRIHGQAWLGGRRIDQLPAEKRKLGLMLQQDYLFPHMTVADNLLFALRGGSRRERLARVDESLASAGLAGMQGRKPDSLSGGQRSRVSLLRTLLSRPQALLLDEPFSSLDQGLRAQIRAHVWQEAEALPVLLVTHDRDDIPTAAKVMALPGLPDA